MKKGFFYYGITVITIVVAFCIYPLPSISDWVKISMLLLGGIHLGHDLATLPRL